MKVNEERVMILPYSWLHTGTSNKSLVIWKKYKNDKNLVNFGKI